MTMRLAKAITAVIFAAVLSLLTACGGSEQAAGIPAARTITDAAGRTVSVPEQINSVYSVNPVGTIFMYTLAPDKIAGRNWELAAAEKKYTLPAYQRLPVLGGYFGKDKVMNKEEVLKVGPDILLSMGEVDSAAAASADSLQQQLGIPVVVVGLELESMAETYAFMGSLLGVEERAGELAQYCREALAAVQEQILAIPADKRIRVYYAEGDQGLETDPQGSWHTEVLDLVRGINVADVALQSGYGRARVSIEQLLIWEPEVIIVCYDQSFQALNNPLRFIREDANWRQLKAVRQNKVYQIPYAPFNWFDRPPSVNRLIGVKWLANLLYPGQFHYNMAAETKKFYRLFYHLELTDQEVAEILQNAQ